MSFTNSSSQPLSHQQVLLDLTFMIGTLFLDEALFILELLLLQ